ncbi:Protein SYS1 -like protein [Trichinella spiralis]|uniref:Protein SYS1-like protein n=1 Tax=Trichinella spiralis TaxID=6334 RepID=A0A0V1B305_TRISP|nr:Protein SYS1 -like protein [Trichinella spiralis]
MSVANYIPFPDSLVIKVTVTQCFMKVDGISIFDKLHAMCHLVLIWKNCPAMANGFYSTKRDPLLLALQILAMQALFYSSLLSLQAVVNYVFDYDNSLNQIFDIQAFRLRNWENITRLLVNVVNSVLMAIALRFVVCRAKLCLDFACTFYIFHFLACWISRSAIPTVASWWLLQLVCITITTVLGEYLCMQVELQDIPVLLGPRVDFSINLNGAIFQLFNAMHKTLVMLKLIVANAPFCHEVILVNDTLWLGAESVDVNPKLVIQFFPTDGCFIQSVSRYRSQCSRIM